MKSLLYSGNRLQDAIEDFRGLDFLALLALRLYLAPAVS